MAGFNSKVRCESPPTLAPNAARPCLPHEGDINASRIKDSSLPLVRGRAAREARARKGEHQEKGGRGSLTTTFEAKP